MSNHSKPEFLRQLSNAEQYKLRCEPLLSRIDPFLQSSYPESNVACTIHSENGLPANGSSFIQIDPPFFTRLISDADLLPNIQRLLARELDKCGVAWLGNIQEPNDQNKLPVQDGSKRQSLRIAPVPMNDPIDVESLMNATAVELQLFGRPFQPLPKSRRASWTPGLPIDVAEFEELEKRVGVLRMLAGGASPIGAAVAPGAVYEDLRFLIDSGFDFLTLLVDVQYALSLSGSLQLAPLESTIEQSIKAVQDSGSKVKILVSANLTTGIQMFRFLQMGVSAICIDHFIAQTKPKDAPTQKDTFGSVLSNYAPASSAAQFTWLKTAVAQLAEEMTDCAVYAGHIPLSL